ncbi:aspartate ammonia-lyase [Flavobacterium resistens]|uniref:Aspartate ammonia-lyase n=1 Tax=Flavobacterium resistens TaxID=443612 RepID=A0ABW9Q725_9FLAO|nr:lyase family protein [Flavobacterium resistens]MRX68626.1 aspartate ammonia-lyase [Flavobacterium resistens]
MYKKIQYILLCGLCITSLQAQTRTEKDLLGDKQIPANAYYGVQTARALENFQISGMTTQFYPDYVRAFAMVKLAAARANADVGRLKKDRLGAIEKACQAVIDGKYHDQFLVDLYQGGAGTSANMNVNEVLANIALEMSGHKKGDEFKDVLKMGRTEGQDAVPMTVGQEFHAFGNQLDAEVNTLRKVEVFLCEQNMGATAIGTGITASPGYAEKVATHLAKITGKPIVMSKDLIAATTSQQGFVLYSSALKSMAVAVSKISSDLIILTSGPRTGIFEINLPALQPGSSIMPGKVNPVMPELMNQLCFKVMGNDLTVTLAAHSGLLQLNAYEPIEAIAMMESQGLFFKSFPLFRKNCIDGITVNKDILNHYMERSVGIVTALNPVLGYEKTTELAKEALATNKGILELIREKKLLTEDQIKKLLDPASLTGQK